MVPHRKHRKQAGWTETRSGSSNSKNSFLECKMMNIGIIKMKLKARKLREIVKLLQEAVSITPGSVLLLCFWRGKTCPPEMGDDVTAVGDGDKFLWRHRDISGVHGDGTAHEPHRNVLCSAADIHVNHITWNVITIIINVISAVVISTDVSNINEQQQYVNSEQMYVKQVEPRKDAVLLAQMYSRHCFWFKAYQHLMYSSIWCQEAPCTQEQQLQEV